MSIKKEHIFVLVLALFFIAANTFLTFRDVHFLNILPIALLVVFFTLFKLEYMYYFVGACVPLAINFEKLEVAGLGISLPTEPVLAGMTLIIIGNEIISPQLDKKILRNPIVISVIINLIWIAFTTVTSEMPLVSLKYLVARIWFVVPLLIFGVQFFKKKKRIEWFLWLYIGALTIVVFYTLIHHFINGFSEEAGHWVMNPFYKDHTSYGAITVMTFPVLVAMFFTKGRSAPEKFLLSGLLLLFSVAIFYSYTRAAWVTLIGIGGIFLVLKLRIRFWFLASVFLIGVLFVAVNWHEITYELSKNKTEHTTENFDERIQSVSNISTDASNLERINRWNSAIRMFQEKPLFGFGPGTYAFQYAPFQHSSEKTIISTNFGNLGNAHSEFLGPLSESGLIGMLTVVAIVFFIFYRGFTFFHKIENYNDRILYLGILLGLVSYFAHGLLNNYLDTDKASVPVWSYVAILIAFELYHTPKKTS